MPMNGGVSVPLYFPSYYSPYSFGMQFTTFPQYSPYIPQCTNLSQAYSNHTQSSKHVVSSVPYVSSSDNTCTVNDSSGSHKEGLSISISWHLGPADANLFVYHLPPTVDEAGLRRLFEPFGIVISTMVRNVGFFEYRCIGIKRRWRAKDLDL